MANLDSRSKRASSVQILSPWIVSPVSPDGTISQGNRQHIAWMYSGLADLEIYISRYRFEVTGGRYKFYA